ncbi:hypothetical protein RCL1_008656 [Eukaryota sp. TZLM3-RCL]
MAILVLLPLGPLVVKYLYKMYKETGQTRLDLTVSIFVYSVVLSELVTTAFPSADLVTMFIVGTIISAVNGLFLFLPVNRSLESFPYRHSICLQLVPKFKARYHYHPYCNEEDLLDRSDYYAELFGHGLRLVTGPPGCGKRFLVTQAFKDSNNTIWVHNDIVRQFLSQLCLTTIEEAHSVLVAWLSGSLSYPSWIKKSLNNSPTIIVDGKNLNGDDWTLVQSLNHLLHNSRIIVICDNTKEPPLLVEGTKFIDFYNSIPATNLMYPSPTQFEDLKRKLLEVDREIARVAELKGDKNAKFKIKLKTRFSEIEPSIGFLTSLSDEMVVERKKDYTTTLNSICGIFKNRPDNRRLFAEVLEIVRRSTNTQTLLVESPYEFTGLQAEMFESLVKASIIVGFDGSWGFANPLLMRYMDEYIPYAKRRSKDTRIDLV